MMSDAVRAMLDTNASASTPTAPLDEYLAAEEHDSNLWWRLSSGHQQNLFEEAVARMQNAEAIVAQVQREPTQLGMPEPIEGVSVEDGDAFMRAIEDD